MANAGKLTDPSRTKSSLHTKQMYDEIRNSPNSKTKPGQTPEKEEQEMIAEAERHFTPPNTTRSGRRRIVSNHTQDIEEEKEGAVVAKHEDEPNHRSAE